MNKDYYILIDGEKVPVSEEVYRAFKRPAWTERKRRLDACCYPRAEPDRVHYLSCCEKQCIGYILPGLPKGCVQRICPMPVLRQRTAAELSDLQHGS